MDRLTDWPGAIAVTVIALLLLWSLAKGSDVEVPRDDEETRP